MVNNGVIFGDNPLIDDVNWFADSHISAPRLWTIPCSILKRFRPPNPVIVPTASRVEELTDSDNGGAEFMQRHIVAISPSRTAAEMGQI
jgi:hypothetical protein